MENGTENKNPATHGNGRAHTVDTAKRKRIMIIAAVCLISVVVIMAIAIPNCEGGTQGIEVISTRDRSYLRDTRNNTLLRGDKRLSLSHAFGKG